MRHGLVLSGGRVVDPETRFDGVADVGIDGGTVTAIGDGLDGATTVDVRGLVVAPGFIDLHSHAQTLPGRRLQACDGVTTALDLEAGRAPVELAYAKEATRGSPINYGFSASWAAARMHVVAGAPLDGGAAAVFGGLIGTEWQQAATEVQVARILDQISTDLAAGAVGVGLLVGYTPGVDPTEYLAVADLAAAAGVPTFTHSRDIVELAPETLIDGAEEVVRAAGATGAHMHYCHVNSTAAHHIDRVLALVGRCQAEGARVTTEAYPYGSGSTAIGAAFLAPERLRERFRDTTSITYLPTGERVADDERLRELRATDPGGLVIADFLDESDPTEAAVLRRSLAFPERHRRQRRHASVLVRDSGDGHERLAVAARGRHAPAHDGHVRSCPPALAGRGRAAPRGRPAGNRASRRGAPRLGARDAPQGSGAGRDGRRPRGVRRGPRHGPGDLRRVHPPVVRLRPRPRRRDLRRARRRAHAGRASGPARAWVTAVSRFGLVVVDPVRAFTDPTGVIGRVHPPEQFGRIVETVERLAAFAAGHAGPKVWVGSLYAPGQFSGGDLDHPLAQLCTDASGADCAWDPRLVPPADAAVVTKTVMDAGECPEFVEATEAMVGSVDAVLITGFWLTACVAATATSCAQRLAGRVPVVVPLSLAATRLGLYDPSDDHPADLDVATRLEQLRAQGVVVCETEQDVTPR